MRQRLHPVPDFDLDGDPASLGKAGREPAQGRAQADDVEQWRMEEVRQRSHLLETLLGKVQRLGESAICRWCAASEALADSGYVQGNSKEVLCRWSCITRAVSLASSSCASLTSVMSSCATTIRWLPSCSGRVIRA